MGVAVPRVPKLSVALASLLVGAPLVAGGCGHCDGAVRRLRARTADCYEGCEDGAAGRVTIAPGETFGISADGPNAEEAALFDASGIGPDNLFLVVEATGERVPATIEATAGGHMCLHGVSFTLRPLEPLAPGDYTLVLLLDEVAWPHAGRHAYGRVGDYQGARAMVRTYRVDG